MRTEPLTPGQYYHIYNRGVNQEDIFFSAENWAFFIQRLQEYFKPELIEIVAYCLMPNHFHLLVYVKSEDVGRTVMQPFTVSYAKAINRQQQRSGHLFQGPYQVKRVGSDAYLKWLSRYIHLNPVTANLAKTPADWLFSSYRDYIGLRHGTLSKPAIILDQFPSPQAYAEFVESDIRPEAGLATDVLFDEMTPSFPRNSVSEL